MTVISQFADPVHQIMSFVSDTCDSHKRSNRWRKPRSDYEAFESASVQSTDVAASPASEVSSDAQACPPPPCPIGATGHISRRKMARPAACPSYILQHYHSTGCAGGAFSFRAAAMDPHKGLVLCREPREYRQTTLDDIQLSKSDKSRGGGPRVGPFQECIPGSEWRALPKYDFTTKNRSSAFNERMHVEWENHVDHILHND